MKKFSAMLAFVSAAVSASGPTPPLGWEVIPASALADGQPCCKPADLNGSKLIGGAILLKEASKNEFGLFALTYTSPLKEHWQLLERFPLSALPTYSVQIVKLKDLEHKGIRVCSTNEQCRLYFTDNRSQPLRPHPL